MNLLGYIVLFTVIGSILSLIGGVLLLVNRKLGNISHILSSFAAGALLGAVFFEIFPEGVHQAEENIGILNFFMVTLLGILTFYLLERVLHWQHNYDEANVKEPVVPMIVIGDTIHNFVDGIAIASAFLVNIPFGIVTALVVGAHEIPQEIGDFGVLLKKGLRRKSILLINLISAVVSLIGAILTFYIGTSFVNASVVFIAISAGFFLYISLSNLIPEIHHENRKGFAFAESMALMVGLLITYIAIINLHNLLPEEVHNHDDVHIEEMHEEQGTEIEKNHFNEEGQ